MTKMTLYLTTCTYTQLLPVRQCWGSVTFWCGSGSPDPYLWLMDPAPDPTPDPTYFFNDFKDAKNNIFFILFLIICQQAHLLQSKKCYFLRKKFCVRILFCRHFFSPLNTSLRKGKDPDPAQYLWLMDPDPGGPKTCRSCGSGSGSGPGSPKLLSGVYRMSLFDRIRMVPSKVGDHWSDLILEPQQLAQSLLHHSRKGEKPA